MSRKHRYLAAFSKIQQSPNRIKYLLKVQSALEDYVKAYRTVKNEQQNAK